MKQKKKWKVAKTTLKELTCSYTLPSFIFQKLEGGKGVKAFLMKATEVVIFYKSEGRKEYI